MIGPVMKEKTGLVVIYIKNIKVNHITLYIWRFMIDNKYQGQGFGRESFKQTLDFIKTFPCGEAEYILLSYEPSNELGRKLYGSFGFKEVFKEYLHDDDEVSAMLNIVFGRYISPVG